MQTPSPGGDEASGTVAAILATQPSLLHVCGALAPEPPHAMLCWRMDPGAPSSCPPPPTAGLHAPTVPAVAPGPWLMVRSPSALLCFWNAFLCFHRLQVFFTCSAIPSSLLPTPFLYLLRYLISERTQGLKDSRETFPGLLLTAALMQTLLLPACDLRVAGS